MAEATLLVGCSVAARAALISVTDDIAYMAERLVDKHHLRDRVACVRRVDPPVDAVGLPDLVTASVLSLQRRGRHVGVPGLMGLEHRLHQVFDALAGLAGDGHHRRFGVTLEIAA